MFNADTVIVIGAGASAEADLPTGDQLTLHITARLLRDNLTGQDVMDDVIRDAILYRVNNRPSESGTAYGYKDFMRAAWHISEGMGLAASIDTYMDAHHDDEGVQLCGKLAILRSIMEAEAASVALRAAPGARRLPALNFEKLRGTWYWGLFKVLAAGVSRDNLACLFDRVKVVSFNYDRCLEHFLVEAIQAYYHVSPAEAVAAQARLEIFHPYGSIGPWHEGSIHQEFGMTITSPNQLIDLSRRIRTFTETLDETPELVAMREEISKARQLVFLGFAYHSQNMRVLGPSTRSRLTERIYGTALERSEPDKVAIATSLGQFLDPLAASFEQTPISLLDGRCGQFITEYALALAAE